MRRTKQKQNGVKPYVSLCGLIDRCLTSSSIFRIRTSWTI